jgi:hypothetical protein
MSSPERHLQLVGERIIDVQSGEVLECPTCQGLRDQLHDAERDLARKRAEIRRLNAQLVEDLGTFERSADVDHLFDLWKRLCNHPRSVLDKDRADAIRKILAVKRGADYAYSVRDGRLAILGAAKAATTKEVLVGGRKAGVERYDGIGLIFRNTEKFESFARRGAYALRTQPEYRQTIDEGEVPSCPS